MNALEVKMISFGKKATAAALAVILIMSVFSACGVKTKSGENNSSAAQGTVYVPEYISLPEDITTMDNVYCSGEMIYFTAYEPISMDGGDRTNAEDG